VAQPRKPKYRHRNHADISYTDRVIANCVPNFVATATRVGQGKMRLAAPETPYRRKNLADISYTSQVIANFVPNFVAITTRVNRGKMRLVAFDGPSPKTPL